MATGRHRLHLTARQRLGAIVAAVALLASPLIFALTIGAPAQAAVGAYDNAAIADRAAAYSGQWGGNACRDAHKLDRNGRTVAGDGGGQCRTFVNCILSMVSGGRQYPTVTYFQSFLNAGGQEIKSADQLVKGDIVQVGNGVHTFIIYSRVRGNLFSVVDSNSDNKTETVRGGPRDLGHTRTVALSSGTRAFRMGTVRSTTPTPIPQPQPQPQPTAGPVFAVMNTSETPPDGVWFRDNPNAAGPRLNGYGVYAGDRVQLRCYGTGAPIGAYGNRVWYYAGNLTRPNAPGRANVGWLNAHYVNDGQASNQVVPGVRPC